MDTPPFLYLLTSHTHLGYFHLLSVKKDVAITICVKIKFLCVHVFISLWHRQEQKCWIIW